MTETIFTEEVIANYRNHLKLSKENKLGFVSVEGEMLELALEEIERLKAQQQWIPVSERLPPNEKTVLVYGKLGVDLAKYRRQLGTLNKMAWYADYQPDPDNGHISVTGITHWMPKPPPPESEKGE